PPARAEAGPDPRAVAEAEARAKKAAAAHPVVQEAIEVLDAELRDIRMQTPG
ncbi:MAG: Uma2 family endonuclease, partial [Deltaproteobacteria bacterium]|nr:Uma2 family endonuclease [Deltaproteobacteria bacterium]